jgi:undecaprenyl-diphosphatase
MKKKVILSSILVIISIIFTVLVKTVDVQSVGVNGTDIGFASINKNIIETIGTNNMFYKISEILGYSALALVGCYALVGLYQLIKRKNILKVDKEIIALGCFYVVVLGLYFLFDKLCINYRPVLENGKLEASFPSSHTMLAICVCFSAIWINRRLFKSDLTKIFNILLLLIATSTVVSRFLSGVHWFTDIIGGIIISIFLVYIFYISIKKDE